LVGCCYRCEQRRREARGETSNPPLPPRIGINSTYAVKEHYASEIEKEVSSALMKWRQETYKKQFCGTYIPITAIMSDNALQAISKTSAILKEKNDFAKLTPPWEMTSLFGEQVLAQITTAREVVYKRYESILVETDRKRKETEAKRKRNESTTKGRGAGPSGRKRANQQRKVDDYDEKMRISGGKRPRGRPPRARAAVPRIGSGEGVGVPSGSSQIMFVDGLQSTNT
jgi:hypothetical protein